MSLIEWATIVALVFVVIVTVGLCSPRYSLVNRLLCWALAPVMLFESVIGRVMLAYQIDHPLEGLQIFGRDRVEVGFLLHSAALGVLTFLVLLFIWQRQQPLTYSGEQPRWWRAYRVGRVMMFCTLGLVLACSVVVNVWNAQEMLR